MLIGIGLTLLVGFVWMVVGIIYSNATKDKTEFNLFMINFVVLHALLAFLMPCIFRFEAIQEIIPIKYMPVKVLTPISWSNLGKLALLMVPSSLSGFAGFFILSFAMRKGSHSVAWGIMQSAIVLPFLTGWLILGDDVKIGNILGMIIIILSLVFLVAGKIFNTKSDNKQNAEQSTHVKVFLLLTFLAFFCTGLQQSVTLLPNKADIIFKGTAPFNEDILAWRIPIGALGSMIIWISVCLITKVKISLSQFKNSLLYALVVFTGQSLFFVAVDCLANYNLSGIVYPLAIGCCIIFFSFFCTIYRHEKLHVLEKAGLGVLSFGVLVMALAAVF